MQREYRQASLEEVKINQSKKSIRSNIFQNLRKQAEIKQRRISDRINLIKENIKIFNTLDREYDSFSFHAQKERREREIYKDIVKPCLEEIDRVLQHDFVQFKQIQSRLISFRDAYLKEEYDNKYTILCSIRLLKLFIGFYD